MAIEASFFMAKTPGRGKTTPVKETIGEGKDAPGTDTKATDFPETPDEKQTTNNQENENGEGDDYQPTPQETSETEQNNHTNLLGEENDGEDDYHPKPQETSETEQNNHTNPQGNEEMSRRRGKQRK